MDPISHIRQMMAESKFSQAQKEVEGLLVVNLSDSNLELKKLYLEILNEQNLTYPLNLTLEVMESELNHKNWESLENLLSKVTQSTRPDLKCMVFKMLLAEAKGNTSGLYQLIHEYHLELFQRNIPTVSGEVNILTQRYFKSDFNLILQKLSLSLLSLNFNESERYLKELLTLTTEKSTRKGLAKKFNSIYDLLKGFKDKAHLEIYQNYCQLFVNGIENKKDYKKIIEMVLLFEDFELQCHLLNLLVKLSLEEEAIEYATATVKQNTFYDFVYVDKNFFHLKKFFVTLKESSSPEPEVETLTEEELVLIYNRQEFTSLRIEILEEDNEEAFINLLKYQVFNHQQLIDLSVCFLQCDLVQSALAAANKAHAISLDEEEKLKAYYLKFSCFLRLLDYRAALDVAFIGLEMSRNENDVLCFLYGQAEVYIKMNNLSQAKATLKKILSINSTYRMAKEKLARIDEI